MGKSNINIKYKCLGASKQVTGSLHYLSVYIENKRYNIVVDYGMVQNNMKKLNELYRTNKKPKSIKWEEIDYLILTHSHADHCGLLPMAIMQGYKGDIITTAPCIKLTELILTDSAYIQAKDTERYNKTKEGKKNPLYPIYSQRHVSETMDRFRGYDYNKKIVLNEHITLTLKSAGHLLGACMPYLEIRCEDEVKRILFTGDTSGKKKIPFSKVPSIKDMKVDYLFSEGTYGDRLQKKDNSTQKLKKHMRETLLENKGKLVLPVFSVGRSSTVIQKIYNIMKSTDEFNGIEIILASPMACKSHRIYGEKDSFNFYNESYSKYRDMFYWDKVQFIEEYKILEQVVLNKKPQLVLVSSGMITGGYSNAVVSSMLPHENSTILFCGFQGLGSTGRTIMESEYGDTILIDGKKIKRKCNIDFMSMSGHADYRRIIELIKDTRHTKIKKIYLNHGDENALTYFKRELDSEFNADVFISDYDKWYKL